MLYDTLFLINLINLPFTSARRLFSAKELMCAVESGDLKSLKELITEHRRWRNATKWITLIDKKGRTPLHLASLHGHGKIMRFILECLTESIPDKELRKEYVNILDRKGRTSIYHAATGGHGFVLRSLIDVGVDMEKATNGKHPAPGSTAIMASAEKGHTECFNILLDLGADLLAKRKDGADAFYLAAMNGHVDIVDSIVNTEHMRIVCHDIVDKATYRNRTPLCTAAFHGHLPIVKMLFAHGANLNHQDDDNFSPLILASYEGHLKMVKWLLRNGSDPTHKDKFGDTALESSDICGHTDVCSFLLKWQNVDYDDSLRKESITSETGYCKDKIDITKQKLTKSKVLTAFR